MSLQQHARVQQPGPAQRLLRAEDLAPALAAQPPAARSRSSPVSPRRILTISSSIERFPTSASIIGRILCTSTNSTYCAWVRLHSLSVRGGGLAANMNLGG